MKQMSFSRPAKVAIISTLSYLNGTHLRVDASAIMFFVTLGGYIYLVVRTQSISSPLLRAGQALDIHGKKTDDPLQYTTLAGVPWSKIRKSYWLFVVHGLQFAVNDRIIMQRKSVTE